MNPTDYLQLAKECIKESEGTKDQDRKSELLRIARLYSQAALSLGGDRGPTADLDKP